MPTESTRERTSTDAETSPDRSLHGSAGFGPSDRRTTLLIACGLFVLALAVYLRTLHNGFISYDDYDYITDNPFVQQGLTWKV